MMIDGRILKILDDCGDTSTITDWVESIDGLNPVDETTLVKQGSHSMALGIDADLNVGETAYWTNSQAQGDLSEYQNDWVYLWIYFSSVAYLAAGNVGLTFYLGSDWTHYAQWNIQTTSLSAGWNLIKCDLDNPSSSVGTIDWTAIDTVRIRVWENAGNTNDFIIYIDSIMLVRSAFSLVRIFRTRRR